MPDAATGPSIEVSGLAVQWDPAAGILSCAGVRSAMLWLDPSLLWLLAPMAEELGIRLYRMIVAHNANLGADDDWRAMVRDHEFTRGFERWADAIAASGWGRCALVHFDRIAGVARVEVVHPWELAMQANLSPGRRWGCPFLMGKLVGLFFHGLGGTCWAEEDAADDGTRVTFTVRRSSRTFARELEILRATRAGDSSRGAELARRVVRLEATCRELEARVASQAQEIRRLTASGQP
jgi:rsbT co-antagonist protein RsbR